MGLGSLLFNSDTATEQLNGGGAPVQPQTPPPPSAEPVETVPATVETSAAANDTGPSFIPVAPFQVSEDTDEAQFVMLWPALGCPQILDSETPALEIIFYFKQEAPAVTKEYVLGMLQHILVLEWDQARAPYNRDDVAWSILGMNKTTLHKLLAPGESMNFRMPPMGLLEYQDKVKESPLQLGELLHSSAEVVPRAYLDEGFKSVASVKLLLKKVSTNGFKLEQGKMYNLFYGPENGMIRRILQDFVIFKKPYDDIPRLTYKDGIFVGGHLNVYRWRHDPKEDPAKPRCGDRKDREHLVRLFHPFSIARADSGEYLNVGHLTDLHTSSLWDYLDEKIFHNYNVDQASIKDNTGRNPDSDANSLFRLIAHRYNSPNLNVRNLTYLLNQRKKEVVGNETKDRYVDLIMQTGDLIDFNRGFNHKPSHDPEKDYVFNLNWIRYYELLLLDYERPTYTLLGNHEYRLNPYPPRITAETVHLFLLLYVVLMTTSAGASCGSVFGALEDEMDNSDPGQAIGKFFLQILLVPFIASLVFGVMILLLGGAGIGFDNMSDILFGKEGKGWWLVGGGWVFGYLIIWFLFVILIAGENNIKTAADGAKCGAIVGVSIGAVISIVALFYMFDEFDYMKNVVNLYGEDFAKLLDDKGVAYLNAFGDDGIFKMTDQSVDWYSLVINPFPDYAFQYGNMLFMMANWSGSEVLTADPPFADDVFTEHQWKLYKNWETHAINHRTRLTDTNKDVVPIFGIHTPVFCPKLDVDLDKLHTDGKDIDDGDIARGTMIRRRLDLIKRFYKLAKGSLSAGKKISAMSLTGHTHDYDIFLMDGEKKTKWHQREHYKNQLSLFNDTPVHITTSCAGPPSDGKIPKGEDKPGIKELLKEYDNDMDSSYKKSDGKAKYKKGERVPRPAGGRVITFDKTDGSVKDIEEISSNVSKWGDEKWEE